MRIIIACAGSQKKWNNYLGVRSHFAPVGPDREPLLHRTVRQLERYGDDISITCPVGFSELYAVDGAVTYEVEGTSEFDSTRFLWSNYEETVLLLGDVYFSDLALRKIFGLTGHNRYVAFGRHGSSNITGTPYGELFAHIWCPAQNHMLDRHLDNVARARETGILRPHGWMLLRSVQQTPMNRHAVKAPWFQEINDWTDDIDFPEDYQRHPATRDNL